MSSGADKTALGKKLGGITGKGFVPGRSGNPSRRPKKSPITERYAAIAELPVPDYLLAALKLSEAERLAIKTYGDALALSQFRAGIKGKTDYAVWQRSNGTYNVILSSTGKSVTQQWGESGDIPVPADYDGDGKTDYAVWRPSNGTWYILPSSTGVTVTKGWGLSTDMPVPGDYDGDTKADIAVFRPSNGTWYIIPSSNPNTTITTVWGQSGDIPVPKDYDGDEKTDVGIYRPSDGTWYILPSLEPGLRPPDAMGSFYRYPGEQTHGAMIECRCRPVHRLPGERSSRETSAATVLSSRDH